MTRPKRGTLSTRSRKQVSPFQIWGLTGGVAAGKSMAASYFREAGIPVIDADCIAHDLTKKGGAAYDPILKRFGTVDRTKLREIVFSDLQARKDLEAILHPLIHTESLRQMRSSPASLMIYEAALLVETGRYQEMEGLIVVDAPSAVRMRRLMERDLISRELAEKILITQTGDENRKRVATVILDNSGSPENLKKQVEALVLKMKAGPRATASNPRY